MRGRGKTGVWQPEVWLQRFGDERTSTDDKKGERGKGRRDEKGWNICMKDGERQENDNMIWLLITEVWGRKDEYRWQERRERQGTKGREGMKHKYERTGKDRRITTGGMTIDYRGLGTKGRVQMTRTQERGKGLGEIMSKVYLGSMCTAALIGWDPVTLPHPPRIWAHIRWRYWSTKINDISLWPPARDKERTRWMIQH